MAYTLPHDVYLLLEDAFSQDKNKADIFAKAIEESIQAIDSKALISIESKTEQLKAELYNDLRSELATKEFVRAEVLEVRAEIAEVRTEIAELRAAVKHNEFLLKILIGIAIFGLTLFNPSFVELVKVLLK